MKVISLHENVVVEETHDPTLAAMRVVEGPIHAIEHDDLEDILEAHGL